LGACQRKSTGRRKRNRFEFLACTRSVPKGNFAARPIVLYWNDDEKQTPGSKSEAKHLDF